MGISYSGGGPRLVLELGAALAFIERGIVPDVIAGVSAGAITAMAHATDAVGGKGIRAAMHEIATGVSTRGLGLHLEAMVQKVIHHRGHLSSIGDHNLPVRRILRGAFPGLMGVDRPTIGDYRPPGHPRLLIAASDWLTEAEWWFSDDTLVEDALVASAAIPGIFPWLHHDTSDGQHLVLVDGGVISNQPLSKLVLEGCGTIYACGFSRPVKTASEPQNAVHAILDSVQMMMHQCSHLEEEYVRLKLGNKGVVHRLEIDHPMASHHWDFTPAQLEALVEEARVQVGNQLDAIKS
ncbi:MAG: patatin-like phospholipase family protein [Candidatus Dormibacteria bacterium]